MGARATRGKAIAPQTGAPAAPALRLVAISKRFGRVLANDQISLDLGRGEIHALLGENGAGKTTLMNIVFGLLAADEGRIEVNGTLVQIRSPRGAFDVGIGMVHQHFKLVPDMTVAENVALAQGRGNLGPLRLGAIRSRLKEVSTRFGLEVDPDAVIEELSVGEQQRVEIMKLLFREARLLILDEPTGVLTPPEWQDLAGVLRALAHEGRSVIFISHKLEEATQIADRLTVLRDGRVAGTREVGNTTKEELARMMVGRDVTLRVDREPLDPGEPVLELRGLRITEGDRNLLSDLNLTVREREVIGVAGVEGNGQRELVEGITGIRACSAGEVIVDGTALIDHSPAEFIDAGGALIPPDRRRTGVAQGLSVGDNLLLKDYARAPFSTRGILRKGTMRQEAQRLVDKFDIRPASPEALLRELSGGNQQKVVLARELDRRPRLLIAAQPTRGLDVGAAEAVYERLGDYKREGGAVLLISTELDEVHSLADRIVVIVNGRFGPVLNNEEADVERLGMLMGGERGAAAPGSAPQ